MADENVIRPEAFRRGVQAIAVDGAKWPVNPGTRCSVGVSRCVGLDEDGFVIYDGAAATEFHFCRRHALAAEALVTYAGFRGSVIPQMLALVDAGELDPEPPRIDAPKRRRKGAWWKHRSRA